MSTLVALCSKALPSLVLSMHFVLLTWPILPMCTLVRVSPVNRSMLAASR